MGRSDDAPEIREISRLHDAISSWIRGDLPESRFESDIADALAPGFRIVEPDGALLTRKDVVDGLRRGGGSNPDFRITIEAAEVISRNGGLSVATYVERQHGALRAPTPANRRRSILVLEAGERFRHVFLQETWLQG